MYKKAIGYLLFLLILIPSVVTSKTIEKPAVTFEAEPVILQKADQVISSQVEAYLSSQPEDRVKVWVFFTDKGISDKASFQSMAASITLSDKVLKRRAKVGKDYVTFADLPVMTEYVRQVEQLGAEHRRSSRWLNAASFMVNKDALSDIAALPVVAQIRPVAGFTPDRTMDALPLEKDITGETKANDADALDYGAALTQLTQVNVPAVHNQGYTGAGVTLAIFDTGFRKSHEAFAQHYTDGRVIAEYDFINNDGNTANEVGDLSSQWNHGTYIWSTSGGLKDGSLYGPAYGANFLLAKTEDVSSETPVEEDNWVAALEWADSLGADVITASLGYSDWYTYSDFDGNTATITLAANTCDGLGIVLCNSNGNGGPASGTLTAPADAFNILAVGAVYSSGTLASFSSRGPTYDGRIKPEVCAMGVSTACASPNSDIGYMTANGTSLSTPIVAGVVCLMIEAHPTYTPEMIRLSLMETASNAATPNNDYGWGIIDANAALSWGATIAADTIMGDVPLPVNFSGNSSLTVTSWTWSFGNGDSAFVQNPSYTFTDPGVYDISLTIETSYGDITSTQAAYIMAFADTITYAADSGYAGTSVPMSIHVTNTQPLERIVIPFENLSAPSIEFDSVTRGARTAYFESLDAVTYDPWGDRYTFRLLADNGGGAAPLPPGSGEVMKIYFTIDSTELGGTEYFIDTAMVNQYYLQLISTYTMYTPPFFINSLKSRTVLRGDMDLSFYLDISDLLLMVDNMFASGPGPVCLQVGDCNGDLSYDVSDLLYLVDYMFAYGPPPVSP